MENIFYNKLTILFLAICIIIVFVYKKYSIQIIQDLENFDVSTPTPPVSTQNLVQVKNDAKISAKYVFDEKRDESLVKFDVKIPQNLISTYDLNDKKYGSYVPFQLKGFCNAPNATSDTIEEKCMKLDKNVCSTTSCCVLVGGQKCVAGDERGPTFDQNYNDQSLLYKDRYYYMGNCYGNCSNYMVEDYNRIYTPSLSIYDLEQSSKKRTYDATYTPPAFLLSDNKPEDTVETTVSPTTTPSK